MFIVRCFFLLCHFFVVEDLELSKSTSHLLCIAINSGIHRNPILIHLLFFYFNCLLDYVMCKIAMCADDTALNSSCDKPYDLSQHAEIAYELQFNLKTQNCWKTFQFFINYFLILKCQDLVLKVIYSNSIIKSCYPEVILF